MSTGISKNHVLLVNKDPLWAFEHYYNVPKSKYIDNQVYYPVHSFAGRYVCLQGGRGSAKSYEMARAIVIKMCLQYGFRGVVVRQVRATVKHSIWSVVVAYINKWNLEGFFDIKTQEIRHRQTGALLTIAGMDKPDSFKSINNLTHVFIEEAYSVVTTKGERTEHEGIETIDKSIRSESFKYPKQMWFAYNPYNKNHWLYEWFFDKDKADKYDHYRKNSLRLITNYTDNQFLDKESISRIEADAKSKPEVFRVDGMGLWGDVKVTGLYYKYYKKEFEVKDLKKRYDPHLPLHISFDFNANPYNTLTVKQVHYNKATNEIEVLTLDEICLYDKLIQETMTVFLDKYHVQKGHVYFYGDRSGHNRKTNGVTDYSTVMKALGIIKPVRADRMRKGQLHPDTKLARLYDKHNCAFKAFDRTCRTNPSLLSRRIMLNRIHLGKLSVLKPSQIRGHQNRPLSNQYGGCLIKCYIDADCRETIKDYEYLREDFLTGGKSKKDPERSHTSDADEYFFLTYFDAEHDSIVIDLKK